MLPAALTLVVMRALLRAPHGRGTPRDLGTRVMRAEADVLSALQEAAERGWAKAAIRAGQLGLPGVH